MNLYGKETFGRLDDAEMERLRHAVRDELPIREGRLSLWLQTWDGTYIAINSGASRRFALLRRLAPNELFSANVVPLILSTNALRTLREQWRFVVLLGDRGVLSAGSRLHELANDPFWYSYTSQTSHSC